MAQLVAPAQLSPSIGTADELTGKSASRAWALVCVAILVIAGLIRAVGLSNQLFIHRDDSGIAVWAIELAQTGLFGWTLARPGYVAILAAPYKIFGDIAAGPYLSVAAGLATIGLVGAWAWRLFSPSVAALASALMAASQIHNYYSRAQQPAIIVTLCVVLAGYWYSPLGKLTRMDLVRALGSGALLGVALTCHPSSILLPPLFLLFELALIVERRAWLISAGRIVALLFGGAVPVFAIQLATTRYGVPGTASTDFFTQFLGNYAYQAAGTNHVAGTEDLLYYPLSVLLVEGVGWALPVGAALLWCVIRWIRRRSAIELFLLSQSLGLTAIWSVAGAVGSADHLRVILPALPAAVILAAASVRDLVRLLVSFRRLPGTAVTAGMAIATAVTLIGGAYQALPLMTAATGYREIGNNLSVGSGVPILVSGANDRSWRVALEQATMLSSSTSLDSRGTLEAGLQPSPQRVREVESLQEVILPTGGVPCYLIVAPENDVMGYPGSPSLPEIIMRRYDAGSRAAGSAPDQRALSDWVKLPIFRLEGADTGVQQVQSLAKNGVQLPDRGHYTEIYELTGGGSPGCRP